MPINTLLTLPNALGLFALVNLWTFMLFGFDKIRAEDGTWRVSEGTLLTWAFLGGPSAHMLAALYSGTRRVSSPFPATSTRPRYCTSLLPRWRRSVYDDCRASRSAIGAF